MDSNLLEKRVAKLERRLRQSTLLNRAGGIAVLLFLASSLSRPMEDTLRAHRLDIVNEKGEAVIELSGETDGGRIVLRDHPLPKNPLHLSMPGVIDLEHPENTERESERFAPAPRPSAPRDERVTIDPKGILLRAVDGREVVLSSQPTIVPALR